MHSLAACSGRQSRSLAAWPPQRASTRNAPNTKNALEIPAVTRSGVRAASPCRRALDRPQYNKRPNIHLNSRKRVLGMFEQTIILFDRYRHRMESDPSFNRDLAYEVAERLKQVDFLVERVRTLERTLMEPQDARSALFRAHIADLQARNIPFESVPVPAGMAISKQEFDESQRLTFEMKLFTESFYYLAGRIRTILRNQIFPMPGLTKFECLGIRNVRNKLLEHAEGKDAQVRLHSFACGGPQGPVLRAIRYVGQESIFPDNGLYSNAEELRANLEGLLTDFESTPS